MNEIIAYWVIGAQFVISSIVIWFLIMDRKRSYKRQMEEMDK